MKTSSPNEFRDNLFAGVFRAAVLNSKPRKIVTVILQYLSAAFGDDLKTKC